MKAAGARAHPPGRRGGHDGPMTFRARPPRRRRRGPLAALLVLLALLAAGCLPAAGGRPTVAVFDAPRASAVDGLAEVAIAALERVAPEPRSYGFVDRASLAFLETRSALDDSDAAANAARVARNRGARLAVLLAAPRADREILRGKDGAANEAFVVAGAEALVVRAADGVVLERLRGPDLSGSRELEPDEELPDDPRRDPTVRELALRSVDALAPFLDAALHRALAPAAR